jgi:hypothetical protein
MVGSYEARNRSVAVGQAVPEHIEGAVRGRDGVRVALVGGHAGGQVVAIVVREGAVGGEDLIRGQPRQAVVRAARRGRQGRREGRFTPEFFSSRPA